MTADGQFRDPVPPRRSWLDRALSRVGGLALLVTLAGAGLVVVALAVLFVGLLLLVAELALPGIYLLWVGIAAIGTGLLQLVAVPGRPAASPG
ncbi:MAG: hypothetical protein EON47_22095 [Acetobacteraceae bacterium]|nr:MAG: hypothetical protein EON47_22095 [Acetobacteraceae bacterium]